MSNTIKLCNGLDIQLQGAAEKKTTVLPLASTYAVSPLDFQGVTPKMLVKVGDAVKRGQKVMVLEAMKMENVIEATADGTVTAIKVDKGDSVLEGAPLVIIG